MAYHELNVLVKVNFSMVCRRSLHQVKRVFLAYCVVFGSQGTRKYFFFEGGFRNFLHSKNSETKLCKGS